MKIILASTNLGKLEEIQALLSPLGHELILQSSLGIPDAEETGLSFIENALIKARFAAQHGQLPAIADDSGLCVDYLQGAPGIYSARYAGPNATSNDRNQKLLTELRNAAENQRKAYYYCAAVFVHTATDPTPLLGLGRWEGSILQNPQGEGGFGYDPLFYVSSHGCSAAELNADLKNQLSHRALAFKSLIDQLKVLNFQV